ncbi:hypothetical protein NL676_038529 [Syzygium grande]|nr:hypothetical protein NL676_038529 [Syzygium grande]
MEKKKSRVLIVGATGKLGHELAKASLNFSHPTFALVRETAFADPNKLVKIHSLSHAGVTLLKGSLQDEESLIEAIKKVDVVICAVSSTQVPDQKMLIQAIKKAGSINGHSVLNKMP